MNRMRVSVGLLVAVAALGAGCATGRVARETSLEPNGLQVTTSAVHTSEGTYTMQVRDAQRPAMPDRNGRNGMGSDAYPPDPPPPPAPLPAAPSATTPTPAKSRLLPQDDSLPLAPPLPPAAPNASTPAPAKSRLLAQIDPLPMAPEVMVPFLGDWYTNYDATVRGNPQLDETIRGLLEEEMTRNPVQLRIQNGRYSSFSRVRTESDTYEIITGKENDVILALKAVPGSINAERDTGLRHAHLVRKGDELWLVSSPFDLVFTRQPSAPAVKK